jgi:hypothetical protein
MGVLKDDAEEARRDAQKMSDAFSMLNEEHQQSKEKWKRIQTRLVADVESTTEENVRLKKVIHVEYGHLMTMFTLSITGQAIFVICRNGWCPSLGV